MWRYAPVSRGQKGRRRMPEGRIVEVRPGQQGLNIACQEAIRNLCEFVLDRIIEMGYCISVLSD